MSASPKNAPAAVAAPASAPYTGSVLNGRITASAPWWQDVVRFWVPMLGIGGAVLLQMISVQRQVGELRTDMAVQNGALREEMATLRSDLQGEIATLREEMATLRGRCSGRDRHAAERSRRADRAAGSPHGDPAGRPRAGRGARARRPAADHPPGLE